MVVSLVAPLVKRGVAVGVHCAHRIAPGFQNAGARPAHMMAPVGKLPPQDDILKRLRNPAAIITLALTAIAFMVTMMAIEYAVRIVALNLAVVESDNGHGGIQLPLDGDIPADLTKAPLLDDYDEAVPALPEARSAPITAGLRSTMRHLNSVGGFFSRFRGASFGIFYGVCFTIIYMVLSSVLLFFGPIGIIASMLLTSAITCNLRATWTHATIAAPSKAGFFQRFLPRQTAKKLILPNLRAHWSVILTQIITGLSTLLAERTVQRHGVNWLTVMVYLLPIGSAVVMGVFAILPCHIALIRAEASLLPEDVDCIVPFDRTFNGTVTWEFESCRQKFVHLFTIRGARKTLDKTILKRTIMILVKLCAISFAMTMFFSLVVGLELFVILGKSNVSWFAAQVANKL
jgi:hypothetical protein